MQTRVIHKAVCNHIQQNGHKVHIENIYLWKDWECDVFSVDRDYYTHEFEVKSSRADFLVDMENKVDKHHYTSNGKGANHFYFVCPENMIKKTEVPEYAGLYYCIDKGMQKFLRKVKEAPSLHNNLFDESKWQIIATKLYWKLN